MRFSDFLLRESRAVTHEIVRHPFLLELAAGALAWDKFSYYLEQDRVYLQTYRQCLLATAQKSPPQHRDYLSRFIVTAVDAEEDKVYGHYEKNHQLIKTGKVAPATVNYTTLLKATCSQEPFELCVAAIAPCMLLYQHAFAIAQYNTRPDNLYGNVIDTYTSDGFFDASSSVAGILDSLGRHATDDARDSMQAVFQRSARAELCFFQDAYQKREIACPVIGRSLG